MDSVIRGFAIYFVLLIAIRFSGRRTIAQMTALDFVLLLIIAETTQQAMLGEDFSIVNAATLILTLFGIDIALSYVKKWLPKVAIMVDGTPTVLVRDGEVDTDALRWARLDEEDLLAAGRQQGVTSLDQIRFAILEASGGISVIPKK
ncbi:DUF421 domain-containing protein [Ciceribacter azotifigens]|uniref:DUF421 domain-containing protein n=1 Tax=Ciceribacter azotifigens TaxID=2069303 RepID=UPI003A85759A